MTVSEQPLIPHLASPNDQQVCFQHVNLDPLGVKTASGLEQHHWRKFPLPLPSHPFTSKKPLGY